MRSLLMIGASLAASVLITETRPSTIPTAASASVYSGAQSGLQPVLDNARVRVYRTAVNALSKVDHGSAVIVSIDSGSGEAGKAVWVEDAASPTSTARGTVVVVQPREPRRSPPPAASTGPGEATFTGMSFNPMFENDRVSVIRARMEVGAREAFHTHRSDTIVVHLSGGEIEDTADGKTVVNRWKPGDVEFEELGSSHSARNVGGAVDVVLVALKPQRQPQ